MPPRRVERGANALLNTVPLSSKSIDLTRMPVMIHTDADPGSDNPATGVLRLSDLGFAAPAALLAGFGLNLQRVDDGLPIPGSYWGDAEAGIIGVTVFARDDTPVHSLLHEAGHLIVLPPGKRLAVHTDATDSVEEEDATCYLQIVLADLLPGVGRDRLMADMDAWGYSFRLDSTRAWFEQDAENARQWLIAARVLDQHGQPTRTATHATTE